MPNLAPQYAPKASPTPPPPLGLAPEPARDAFFRDILRNSRWFGGLTPDKQNGFIAILDRDIPNTLTGSIKDYQAFKAAVAYVIPKEHDCTVAIIAENIMLSAVSTMRQATPAQP